MTPNSQQQPSFWRTVKLLLGVARKRAQGRQKRQQQLLENKKKAPSRDWSNLALILPVIISLLLNGVAAFVLVTVVDVARKFAVERDGTMVVSRGFLEYVTRWGGNPDRDPNFDKEMYADEAKRIAKDWGGSAAEIEKKLRRAVAERGRQRLAAEGLFEGGLKSLAYGGPLPALMGSLFLFWWGIMLALQGEGVEVDVQRRRHPMWEWLFSHPVTPGAVFLSEILAPIAANPMLWGAPLYAGILYGLVYGLDFGVIAALVIGVPITIAAGCLGKALEIGVMLRFAPRSRGAILGLMGWLGYVLMMFLLLGITFIPKLIFAVAPLFVHLSFIPAPWLGWFLGMRSDGSFSFVSGVAFCWTAAALVVAVSVWFSVWGAQKGLSGQFAADAVRRGSEANRRDGFGGRDPLYRKELLWFTRDRSALVQAILLPISLAAVQAFNLRGLLLLAGSAWNAVSGLGILAGTYFLWILGPKSLQSEGAALWITLTWPRGLENLLKAKAWLWSLLSSGVVALILGYAAFSFPSEIWKIALVGVGWFFFSRSIAEKSVTLVSVTSSSGETEKIPTGRRWAAQLGMFTFAVGIVTEQWQLAIVGIVYSYMTAAAMWQNFRARLPYLYDPWSEELPPAPTLMHAMISISVLVEIAALLSVGLLFLLGRSNLAAAQAAGYGLAAVEVWFFVSRFLKRRGVRGEDIWRWPRDESSSNTITVVLTGAGVGLVLGIFAHGYMALIQLFPRVAELIRVSEHSMASIPNFRLWYGVMAIGIAPFAEEYLFRGLLFRAIEREWGGWRAVAGSAVFFAMYHPVLAWVPVACLGAVNAWMFRRTGRLAAAVAVHMVYNSIVLLG